MSGRGTPDPRQPVPLRPPRTCPICGRSSHRSTYPFCSRRCADLDLNRWLNGSYAIPGEADDRGEEEGSDPGR